MDFGEARDAILASFKTAWDAATPAIVGYVPLVFYDGVGKPDDPDPSTHFAEVFVRHISGSQTSLSDASGVRRFEHTGLVTVSIHAAVTVAGGLQEGERLAQAALAAFQGKHAAGNLWYRNSRIIESGIDGSWYNVNTVSEFRYDEFA